MNLSSINFSQSESTKARVFYFLLAILVPLALIAIWHQVNTVIPNDDSGNYFETAMRIYRQFQAGPLNGIGAIYRLRGWRPIFFPVLAVPFIALTGENILLSVALTLLSLYAVFLIYVYLLARDILPPDRACLVTLSIAEIPWIFQSAQYFMSELPMVLCALAAIYHFKKSNFLKVIAPTVIMSLWIALGVMIRPAEFVTSLAIPALAILLWGIKIHALRKNDLLTSICFSAMTLTLLTAQVIYPSFLPVWFVLWGGVVILNLACVLAFETLQLSLSFGIGFFLCHVLSSGWWLPYIHGFYEWVGLTQLGFMAVNYRERGPMSLVHATEALFANLGGFPLIVSSGILALAIVSTRKTDRVVYKEFTGGLALALAMILPPVFILSLTPDITYRRVFIGFCFLFLMLSAFALDPRLARPRLRMMLFGSWVVAQFSIASFFTFDLVPPVRASLAAYWGYVGIPVVGGDPSLKTFENLKGWPLEGARIAVLSHSLHNFSERPFDTPGLTLAALKQTSTVSFGYPGVFPNLEEGYKQLLEYDYVLLDVSTGFSPQADTPYARLTEDIIQKWRKGELEKTGLQAVTDFEISKVRTTHEPEKKKKIILFMIQRPGHPTLSIKDDIALARYGSIPGSTAPDQKGFPISHLNDGNELTTWGSTETLDDTIFYITRNTPFRASAFKIVLFSMPNGAHIRDVSVVAANNPIENASWRIIRSRIHEAEPFREKITIPPDPDRTVVTIELDMNDSNWMSYKAYGLACFSKSRGYKRNYVAVGNGIYLREFQVASADGSP